MTIYYLVSGNNIIGQIDTDLDDVTALPLLAGIDSLSLVNQAHIQNAETSLSMDEPGILSVLGMTDGRMEQPKAQG